MKKSLFAVSVISVLLFLVGCETPIKTNITVEPTTLSLYVGDTYSLIATVEPANTVTEIIWASSNTDVAIVDANGVVTAGAEGIATISASIADVEPANCMLTVNNIPSAFPRKFVIEHFTGDGCGYCPGGMYSIIDYIAHSTTPHIWLSHHYGYNTDEYTIPENSKIGRMLGVQGAPTISLNRTKQQPGLAFHPGYLQDPDLTIQDDTTALASVNIHHTFDAATSLLDVTVSGHVADSSVQKYLLTVLIKENRLVGQQADYTYSWKTAKWKEYMHARVVRSFITAHFGDTVHIENQRYSKAFTLHIDENYAAENCCIVAYLTPLSKKPIINAEQVPLVGGTTGGEEYNPYGITEGQGPNKTITFDSLQVVKITDNLLEVQLYSSKSIKTFAGSSKAVGIIHLNTNASTLQAGTYTIQSDNAAGTITAGYRIDEQATLGGSRLIYALTTDLTKGKITPIHMWRINSGDMIVDASGNIKLAFKTYNGTIVTAKLEVASAE